MANIYNSVELTKYNHIRYWFNDDPDQLFRRHPFESAHMSFGYDGFVQTNRTFNECLIDTALEFKYKHPKDFYIFLSGGLDSEIAVRSFLQAGVKFRPIILKFINDFNKEDVESALRLNNELNLNSIVAEIDPIRFFESGKWLDIAKKYQSYTFYQQLLLQAAEDLSSPMITIDEIELTKIDQNNWAFIKNEDQDGCWHRFIEITGIPAYNNFYTYDPDTVKIFLKNKTVIQLINNQIFGKLTWSSSKHQIYSELTLWNMIKRPKRTGMERLMNLWLYVENYIDNELYDGHRIFRYLTNDISTSLIEGRSITCNII